MESGEADQIIKSMDHCRHCFDVVVGALELHIFVVNKCRGRFHNGPTPSFFVAILKVTCISAGHVVAVMLLRAFAVD